MKSFFLGIAFIVGGIMIIPYIKQILDALIDVADTLFPGMNATQSFFVHSLPLFTLVMIFVCGGWLIVSSLIRRGGSSSGE